jgi:hypothetical protein
MQEIIEAVRQNRKGCWELPLAIEYILILLGKTRSWSINDGRKIHIYNNLQGEAQHHWISYANQYNKTFPSKGIQAPSLSIAVLNCRSNCCLHSDHDDVTFGLCGADLPRFASATISSE